MTLLTPVARAIKDLRRELSAEAEQHPEGSPTKGRLLSLLDLSDDELLDEVLAKVDANPERDDCPSEDVLRALALRERSIHDAAWEHVLSCSPCSQQVRALGGPRRRASGSSAARPWVLAAAGVAAVVAVSFILQSSALFRDRAFGAAQTATADLRLYEVRRADEPVVQRGPIILPRSRVNLTLLLSLGFDAGPYEIQLVDASRASLSASTGRAAVVNGVMTLTSEMRLEGVPTGAYQLALRADGDDWQLYPVEIR